MKTNTKVVARLAVATTAVLFLFTACSQMHKEKANSADLKTEPQTSPNNLAEQTHEASPYSLTSSAAKEDGRDSVHSFIRTADIKCRVKNVPNATYAIEDVTRQLGGYVSYTNLTSTVDGCNTIAISADSSLQTIYYNVKNSMIIRVPNTNLDSALKAITPLVGYLDFRTIKANDAALQMLANKFKQQRIARHEERMNHAIDEYAKKLNETNNAEDGLLDKQELADNAKIENMSLNDQVKFSTINLALYQPQTIEKTLVYNEKSVKPYEAGLFSQLADAAQFGWSLFEALLVVFVRVWPLVIVGVIVFVFYRKWKFRTV